MTTLKNKKDTPSHLNKGEIACEFCDAKFSLLLYNKDG